MHLWGECEGFGDAWLGDAKICAHVGRIQKQKVSKAAQRGRGAFWRVGYTGTSAGVRVCNIAAEDAPTTCGYVTPPLAYPQVLSTTWKTYRCVIHRILITCGVITRWHKDP